MHHESNNTQVAVEMMGDSTSFSLVLWVNHELLHASVFPEYPARNVSRVYLSQGNRHSHVLDFASTAEAIKAVSKIMLSIGDKKLARKRHKEAAKLLAI